MTRYSLWRGRSFLRLVGALLATAAGIMLFFDIIRVDDMMFYTSPERGQILANKAKIKTLEENIRDLQSDLRKLKEQNAQERQTLLKAIDSQTKLIDQLREENRKLKWTGMVGFGTVLDKILGILVAIMGAITAYMILKLKRIELRDKDKPDDEHTIIVP